MTEDLTTYTEVNDPNSKLSTTASRVTLSLMDQVGRTYLYKDFGSSYFNNIRLMFTGRVSSGTNNNGSCDIGFANAVGDVSGWSNYLSVEFLEGVVYLVGDTSEYYLISSDTTYYFTLERNAGSASLKIYSNSARTSLLDTLTCTCNTGEWRYFYPAASYYTNDAFDQFSGYFEDFLFSRSVGGQVRIIGMAM